MSYSSCWALVLTAVTACGAASTAPSEPGTPTDGERGTKHERGGDESSVSIPPDAANGVVFHRRVPAPGTVFTVDRRNETELELSQRQGKQTAAVTQSFSQHTSTRTTVLGASQTAITKKRVDYLKGTTEQRIGDRVQRVPNPLIGKSYVLEARGGKLRASGADGQAPSDYELERLEREHAGLGKPSAFSALLPERPIEVGAELRPEPGAMAEAFGQAGVEVRDASLLFQSLEQRAGEEVGVFRVSLKLVEPQEHSIRETELTGTVVLQAATGWPMEVDLSGPVRIEARPDSPTQLHGTGSVRLRVVTRYETNGEPNSAK